MFDFPFTLMLLIITAITSIAAFSNPNLYHNMIFNPYIIKREKQFYRFITSGIIHADWNHLIFNMITLYFFGRAVEPAFKVLFGSMGGVYFLLMYIGGLIVSSISTFIKHKDHSYYNSLGASGAVSSVLFSFILFAPWENVYLFFAIPIPGIVLAVLYLWYSSHMSKKGGDNINHEAHYYGAIFGLVFPILIKPEIFNLFLNRFLEFNLHL